MAQYSVAQTAQKTALPVSIVVIVNILLFILKKNGFELSETGIDESTLWSFVMVLYGVWLGAMNWLKNRKRK